MANRDIHHHQGHDRDAGGKPFANPHLSFGLRQKQHPTIRGEPATIERRRHFLAANRWKRETWHTIV